MNYELALELKNAGFPQTCKEAFTISSWDKKMPPKLFGNMTVDEDCDGYANLIKAGYDVVASPTLSELIKACGEVMLSKRRDAPIEGEEAITFTYEAFTNEKSFISSSLEEAVARLWLALYGTKPK